MLSESSDSRGGGFLVMLSHARFPYTLEIVVSSNLNWLQSRLWAHRRSQHP